MKVAFQKRIMIPERVSTFKLSTNYVCIINRAHVCIFPLETLERPLVAHLNAQARLFLFKNVSESGITTKQDQEF